MNKKINYIQSQKRFLSNVVSRKYLNSAVEITGHFSQRFSDRKVELNGFKCFNLALNSICRIIYEFEMGNKPYCLFENVRIDFKRDQDTKKIVFATIYEDRNKKGKGIYF